MKRILVAAGLLYLVIVILYLLMSESESRLKTVNLEVWLELPRDEMADVLADIDEYRNKNPHVDVRVKNYAFASLKPQFESHFRRGTAPDILLGVNDWMGQLAESEYILPLDRWLDRTVLNGFDGSVRKAMSWNNNIYGLPQRFECLALIINRELIPHIPRNTDELADISRELSSRGVHTLMVDYANYYFHAPWLAAWHEKVLQDDGEIKFNTPGMKASLEFVRSLLESGVISRDSSGESAIHQFSRGQTAMLIDGPWSLSGLGSIEISIEPLPKIPNAGLPRPFLAYKAFMVSTSSQAPGEAVQLATYLSRQFWKRQEKDSRFKGFRAASEQTRFMPNHPNMKTVWALGNVLLDRVLRRGDDIDTTLEQIQSAALSVPAASLHNDVQDNNGVSGLEP